MIHRLGALASGTLIAIVVAATASGHLGAAAAIAIGVDHVQPGEAFSVSVSDVTPAAVIEFTLRRDAAETVIGNATSGPDGHFETTLTVPTDTANGFSELIASSADGTSVSTWVLVGPGQPGVSRPPSPNASGLDPSVIVLLVLLVGAIGAVGYLVLRPRPQAPRR